MHKVSKVQGGVQAGLAASSCRTHKPSLDGGSWLPCSLEPCRLSTSFESMFRPPPHEWLSLAATSVTTTTSSITSVTTITTSTTTTTTPTSSKPPTSTKGHAPPPRKQLRRASPIPKTRIPAPASALARFLDVRSTVSTARTRTRPVLLAPCRHRDEIETLDFSSFAAGSSQYHNLLPDSVRACALHHEELGRQGNGQAVIRRHSQAFVCLSPPRLLAPAAPAPLGETPRQQACPAQLFDPPSSAPPGEAREAQTV
ncbi:hypothetical protein G7046_g1442 [Stylonectria norvegica]|nr:hypothetical protein G7046_g1442 [Stylonectria norvegica]